MPHGGHELTVAALGELQVRRGTVALDLGPVQQRVVLAVLLLNANRALSRDSLIAAVWGDSAPKSVVNLVHRHASGVRRALEPERTPRSGDSMLTWTNSAYRLALPPDALDVTVFEAALDRAKQERSAERLGEAAAALRTALGLWRGPLCGGLSSPFLDSERDRLAELRVRALADRIDLDLALGSPADLVGELRRLVAEHPAQERLHGLLMRALCREGRAADALGAYAAARRYLDDELGIEPSEPLRELQQRVLAADPTLATPVAASGTTPVELVPRRSTARRAKPEQLPHALSDFVGRTGERADLHAAVADAERHSPLIIAITGTAGVGKTTLAVQWAHEVKARFPDGQIFLNLRGFDPHQPPAGQAAAIRTLLDALGVPAEQVPVDPDAQAGLYRSQFAGRRILVLLDNASDAAQVRPLLPGSEGSLVLVTSRDQLISLVAVDSARPVMLNLLSDDVARELLARRLGAARVDAEPAAVDAIIEACARLPLALSIVAARGRTTSHLSLARLADELRRARGRLDPFDAGDLAANVRAVFSWSYTSLPGPTARLFRLLALVPGPDVTVPAVRALAELSPTAAHTLLEQLTRAHLVSERMPGRYGMHDLLRAYASELVDGTDAEPLRRAALRRVLDHYLHTAHRADELLNRGSGTTPIELEPPVPGVGAEPLRDHQDAFRWFEDEQATLRAATRQAAETGFPGHAWRLAWTLNYFLNRHGDWHELVLLQEIALGAAQRLGDVTGQAASHVGVGWALVQLGRLEEADGHVKQALKLYEQVGDRLGMAHALRSRSGVLDRQRRFGEGLRHAERALDLFRAADFPTGEARALNAVGWFHAMLGDYEASLRFCRAALELQRRIGARPYQADTLDSIGRAYHRLGRYDEAATNYQAACALYHEFGDRYNEADQLVLLGDVRRDAGDLEGARTVWREALHIFQEMGHADADLLRARLAS
ncbi:AfsR/SARP family transcriptional regulator [Actinophytocola sp.]|uniref:AfsR/SARP family transcriptional regulator n=1 Tax=Actinophytocola sp. TaxID=1872138 RepID=UPI00389B24DF